MGYPVKVLGTYREGYVLDKMAFSWFLSITWTTRRLLRQQPTDHLALVTSGDSGRLLVRPTPHMRALHALSLWQAITDTTDSDFQYCWVVSHPRKHHWTRTHRHTARQLWWRTLPSTSGIHPGDSSSVRSSLSSAPRYLARPLKQLSFLLFDSITNNLGVSRVTNFSANTTALGCFHVSWTTQAKSKFHCLSRSAFITFIQSPVPITLHT